MIFNRLKHIVLAVGLLSAVAAGAEEKVFADYFDIPVGSGEGTEVIGKIHLERNKDLPANPIPAGYGFEILKQSKGDYFAISTERDPVGRVTGVLSVREGVTLPSEQATYPIVVALNDGGKLVQKIPVKVKAVKTTLWQTFYDRYLPGVTKNPRLYGKKKLKDEEVAAAISDLKAHNGRFSDEKCYTTHPKDYPGRISEHDHWLGGTIEYDWINVANRIGQLGYAYATSKVYGPEGNPAKRAELGEAIKDAILAYTNSVPVYGSDILVDGKPIGPHIGDGTSMLQQYKWASHQVLTHQWVLTDPLVVPVLYLMPEILEGIAEGDEKSRELYDSLVRYFQVATAIVKGRRAIDNPEERWGEIQNPNYSSGAWADANLGHRSRTLLALPIIWADYNRPMTYVPYWYESFYGGKPYEGFTFAPGWSPHGVVADVAYWMTRNNIPAHSYAQSGYQPDGTISHHTGHGTDAAMVAYGFEWMTDLNNGFQYFKNTPYEVPGKHLQFELDRLLEVYPVMIYKGGMDNLVAGRSFLQDQGQFVRKTYAKGVNSLLKARSKKSDVSRADELKEMLRRIKSGEFEMTGVEPFWVNEYLVYRQGDDNGLKPFFASVKLKSERTVGAEDFDKKVRHSWHMGSGVMQMKVRGDEYSVPVLANFDWHSLPGLTEEWRTDPLPLKGGSQASLPGDNKIAGVLGDGVSGMAIYLHLPREKYSSAKGFKSYGFLDGKVFAQGSGIERYREGQGKEIATFVDQGAMTGPLTLFIDGKTTMVNPGESVDITGNAKQLVWAQIGAKGYVILTVGTATIRVVTGDEVNVTDCEMKVKGGRKPGYIIAVSHGANPSEGSYVYAVIPNVTARDMPAVASEIARDYEFVRNGSTAHALRNSDGTSQFAFFEPGSVTVGDLTVSASDAAQFMLRETTDGYTLSVQNPVPDDAKQTLTFTTSKPLPAGTYEYTCGGIYPIAGETVTITPEGKGSKIIVELPDSRDETKYNYQTILYSGVPVVVNIPKK